MVLIIIAKYYYFYFLKNNNHIGGIAWKNYTVHKKINKLKYLFSLLCELLSLHIKQEYDKMKDEDSSSAFELFHSILIFFLLLFIQELFLKRKECARGGKSSAIYHYT